MKKGFTLIELLAVIVILAIIALIATPIVLSIINDTKESASLRSAEMYLDALELSVAQAILKGTAIEDGTYKILENGNICQGYKIDGVTCINEVKVEVKGDAPKENSKVTIVDGKIKTIKLKYEDKEIVKDEKSQIVYFENEYTIGDKVTFNPGDQDRTWNVIAEDATTVTLMLSENLDNTVAWYKYSNYNSRDNSYGPKDVLEYLNSLTINWDNVDPIESYTYINNLNGTTKPYGYQKLEIKNGVTKLTHKDGKTITDVTGVSKARILSKEEVYEIAQNTKEILTEENLRVFIERNLSSVNTELGTSLANIDEVITFVVQSQSTKWLKYESKYFQTYYTVLELISKYGIETTNDISLPSWMYQKLYSDRIPNAYWTFSTYPIEPTYAWIVKFDGIVYTSNRVDLESGRGVRPVITISKSKLVSE